MVSKENKVATSRAYLHHIADVCVLRDAIDAYMYVARFTGCDKAIASENARRLEDLRMEIADARERLAQVDGDPGLILEMYVFEGKKYDRIGVEVGYSASSVKRLAHKGMVALYDYLPAEWK